MRYASDERYCDYCSAALQPGERHRHAARTVRLVRCQQCGAPLSKPATGALPRFCGDTCRKAHQRALQKAIRR